jgi:hypothetical protein
MTDKEQDNTQQVNKSKAYNNCVPADEKQIKKQIEEKINNRLRKIYSNEPRNPRCLSWNVVKDAIKYSMFYTKKSILKSQKAKEKEAKEKLKKRLAISRGLPIEDEIDKIFKEVLEIK